MFNTSEDGRISKKKLILTMQLIRANGEVENMIRKIDMGGESLFLTVDYS